MPLRDARAQRRQALGDLREGQVGSRHREALVEQDLGDPAHADAADAGEMDVPDLAEFHPMPPSRRVISGAPA
jgi:hypothetical protein